MRIRVLSELDDPEALEAVAEALRKNFREEVVIEVRRKLLDRKTLNLVRRQHDAWKVVQLHKGIRAPDEYLLLIVNEDLYAAGLNYVFGLAWQEVAVVSVRRLKQEFYGEEPDRELFIERLMKEAVHEVGHLYGLTHCSNRRCVMTFSNWIGDTDYKSWRLCGRCISKLR